MLSGKKYLIQKLIMNSNDCFRLKEIGFNKGTEIIVFGNCIFYILGYKIGISKEMAKNILVIPM